MEDLITYQPVFISQYTFKIDTLFIKFTFVTSCVGSIVQYFTLLDDLDQLDVTKIVTSF